MGVCSMMHDHSKEKEQLAITVAVVVVAVQQGYTCTLPSTTLFLLSFFTSQVTFTVSVLLSSK
jgi:hypothetical protein